MKIILRTMASFNDEGLRKKFSNLNMSQQSIQTMSLWLIHHKKHAHHIVSIWFKELLKTSSSKKLTFLYLANDVIQNSKKKGPEYHKEFFHRLPKVFKHLATVDLDEKSLRGVSRLLQVWRERGVFTPDFIKDLRKRFSRRSSKERNTDRDILEDIDKSTKKSRSKSISASKLAAIEGDFPSALEAPVKEKLSLPAVKQLTSSLPTKTLTPPDFSQESRPSTPPEPEELLKALEGLENAATADAEVRKKIANLPTSISDINGLSKIKSEEECQALKSKVDEALNMLEVYNKRLADEMENRKTLARLLHDFILHQKDQLSHAEESLEEQKSKLVSVQKIRHELKAHLQNLPDLSKLPNVSGGLVPLPSAGDLFT